MGRGIFSNGVHRSVSSSRSSGGGPPVFSYGPHSGNKGPSRSERAYIASQHGDSDDEDDWDGESRYVPPPPPSVQQSESLTAEQPHSTPSLASIKANQAIVLKRPSAKALPIRPKGITKRTSTRRVPNVAPRTPSPPPAHRPTLESLLRIQTGANDIAPSTAATDNDAYPKSPELPEPPTPRPGEIRRKVVHSNGRWIEQTMRVPTWIFTKGGEHLINLCRWGEPKTDG
ncbi:hypothetical protein PRZ48_012774 [Zasmidium cellare]|uniref:Uncharacterized protein n=1 Tax=Zasmidium cellare TaxID=395010 RepID=A0ABR0E6E8_ZASCE|nr:hypothetical protein PRZ48_012774 [Zasmidium cellare]